MAERLERWTCNWDSPGSSLALLNCQLGLFLAVPRSSPKPSL